MSKKEFHPTLSTKKTVKARLRKRKQIEFEKLCSNNSGKIVQGFEKVEPVILPRVKQVSYKTVSSRTSVVQSKVDRGFQSFDFRLPFQRFCFFRRMESIPEHSSRKDPLISFFWCCDQFPSIFHFGSKAAVLDPRQLSLKK